MEFDGRARIQTELNIAPLIDVVFLLLVFFMLTSTLITQEGVELSLPGSNQSEQIERSPIEVAIQADGGLFLNGTAVSQAELPEKLKTLLLSSQDEPIILKSDATLDVQRLIETMDVIRSAGGTNISLATQRK